jgi:hypothetical protein
VIVPRSGKGWGARLPASAPRHINHAVLTGMLSADPRPCRSPSGDQVTLLRVEFPVADPERPEMLWTGASCLVEMPTGRAGRDVEELRGGVPVIAAGQLSERWVIEDGHTSCCGVIVAALLKSGPPEMPEGLLP